MDGDGIDRDNALGGLLVVDLTTDVAGAYAGKLLCDLGARVVLVEPPGGTPLRRRPPFAPGSSDGALFEHLSGMKESVAPSDDADAATILRGLLRTADVLLVDGTSRWQVPEPVPDHVVTVDVSPFGRTGPYAGWRGSDLAVWALGGYHYFTGAPDREPVWLPGSHTGSRSGAPVK